MDLTNLRVAVIGAGYAGVCTARTLSDLGAQVTVYEQASVAGEVGAGIGLRPSSMDAFRRWGILDAITAVSTPSPGFQILTATGEEIMFMEWPEKQELGLTTHLIHRRDFIDALLTTVPKEMVRWGRKLESITETSDGVTLAFVGGETAEADLVIGADGIKSTVRRLCFTDAAPVFSGEHAYRAVFPVEQAHGLITDDVFRMYINERGSKLYLLPLSFRGQVSFDVTVPSDDDTWAPPLSRDMLVNAMAGFDSRIEAVTQGLELSIVNSRAAYDIDPVESWHTDRVTLVGDAAHAMLHHQGQGANSAVMDADAIAQALADAPTLSEGLMLYQSRRKPVTDELQRISRSGWDAGAIDDVFPGQHGEDDAPAVPYETKEA